MVASESFAEFLREQFAPLGHVAMRRMFGKTGVFCDGVMFGMVTENTLYLRVDDGNRAAFKEAEAFPPLNYRKQGSTIDLSFWRAPERLTNPKSLSPGRSWLWERLDASRRGENGQRLHANQRSDVRNLGVTAKSAAPAKAGPLQKWRTSKTESAEALCVLRDSPCGRSLYLWFIAAPE